MLTQVNGERRQRHQRRGMGRRWSCRSQFMENFCWEWNVLRHMTAACQTPGEPRPGAVRQMMAAKNFQAGMQTLRQVRICAVRACRCTPQAAPSGDDLALLQQVRDEVAVLPTTPYNRSTNTFSHIFAGGYAAGYYSYKWAEVLSADAYAAFEETHNPDGQPQPCYWAKVPARNSGARGQPQRTGKLHRLPWAGPAARCPAAPPRHGRTCQRIKIDIKRAACALTIYISV